MRVSLSGDHQVIWGVIVWCTCGWREDAVRPAGDESDRGVLDGDKVEAAVRSRDRRDSARATNTNCMGDPCTLTSQSRLHDQAAIDERLSIALSDSTEMPGRDDPTDHADTDSVQPGSPV